MLVTAGIELAASASTSSMPTPGAKHLAQQLVHWRKLGALVTALTALCSNLLEQLGALCAEQTRKATILKGVISKL